MVSGSVADLQIAYYHLAGPLPEVLKGTDYEPYADVYAGAWQRILGAVETARRYGMGVMIDLHAAPGGQNHEGESHHPLQAWACCRQ
jgi:aryl-phospho-beta-D-glucosidase BglC (GH1 family)